MILVNFVGSYIDFKVEFRIWLTKMNVILSYAHFSKKCNKMRFLKCHTFLELIQIQVKSTNFEFCTKVPKISNFGTKLQIYDIEFEISPLELV